MYPPLQGGVPQSFTAYSLKPEHSLIAPSSCAKHNICGVDTEDYCASFYVWNSPRHTEFFLGTQNLIYLGSQPRMVGMKIWAQSLGL